MHKVKWGILSTANIGIKHVIPGMQKSGNCLIEAISSRNKEKAQKAASELNIPKSYGSYEDLLADDDIDAIYNPLPNHLHVPWTIKALEAGKHVLCEKPIAINAEEARQLMETAQKYPNQKVMEAFMYRFHPQWKQVKSWVKGGQLGQVRAVNSVFTYYNDDPADVRNQAQIGGGGLLDIGCYCISASRYLFESEPEVVLGSVEYDPDFKTDRLASATLRFPEGTAVFTCSTQASPEQHLTVIGTRGLIEMEIPFNPLENPAKLILKKDGKVVEVKETQANHYTLQGEAFSKAILNNEPVPTSLKDAVANMKIIDAVFESGKNKL